MRLSVQERESECGRLYRSRTQNCGYRNGLAPYRRRGCPLAPVERAVARTHQPPASVTDARMLSADYPLPQPMPSTIFKELSEGGVLLSTSDEVYFGVNPVGARIWSLLPPAAHTFGELCEALEREYPDVQAEQLRADARLFIESLVESGLVIARSP